MTYDVLSGTLSLYTTTTQPDARTRPVQLWCLFTVYYKQTADKTKVDLDEHRAKDVSRKPFLHIALLMISFSFQCLVVS